MEPVAFTKQTVNACNADIVEAIDDVSHQFGSHDGFFRHGQIRRARAHDEHRAVTWRDVAGGARNCPRLSVIRGVSDDGAHGIECFGRGAGHQQRMARADNPAGNRRDLGRSFAYAEDDLRETLADMSMRIDAGVAEIVQRHGAQRLEDPVGRGGRVDRAVAHGVQ
jgi:hypothetical protein